MLTLFVQSVSVVPVFSIGWPDKAGGDVGLAILLLLPVLTLRRLVPSVILDGEIQKAWNVLCIVVLERDVQCYSSICGD
jgi:hypothetical protein